MNKNKTFFVALIASLTLFWALTHFSIHLNSLFLNFILASIFFIGLIQLSNHLNYQKKIQSTLMDTAQKRDFYFNSTGIGFIVVNKDRIITEVNPYFSTIFGYEAEEVIGKTSQLFHISTERYLAWGDEVFKQAQQNKQVRMQEHMKRKDGKEIWVEISGSALQHQTKDYDGSVLWSVVDITPMVEDHKTIQKLNEELSKNIESLHTLIDLIPLPIFVKDKDFKYTQCNQAFLDLLDLDKEEIIGQTNDVLHLDNIEASILHYNDMKLLIEDTQHTKERLNYKGKELIIEFHKVALRQEGKFAGIICVMIDVTKHTEHERYLSEQIESALIHKYQQEKLFEQERLESVQFKTIGQLAAGITHEINTPVTYIKGNLELMAYDLQTLEESETKARLIDDARSMLDGINRIANIVNSMREMSQRSSETKEPTNIYETLYTALTLAHNRSKQITHVYLQGELFDINTKNIQTLFVMIQKQRVEQVWIIIINNALDELIKKEDFEKRSFSIEVIDKEDVVTVRFRDNAGGIREDILETIFEPFQSTKEHCGMGVGLNIAKDIVKEQGGSIRAYNQDFGAVFEVTLPKAEQN